MKPEDRQELFDKLIGPMNTSIPVRMQKEFAELVTKDLDEIEPIIDGMLQNAAESRLWNPSVGAWELAIKISFHSCVQLLAVLKAYEWREPRPGYVNCAECHAEFQATPTESRSHRSNCHFAKLINELQSQIVKYNPIVSERSSSDAIPEHATST